MFKYAHRFKMITIVNHTPYEYISNSFEVGRSFETPSDLKGNMSN